MEKIELGTLMFFAGLFVMMRSLEEMGLMTYIADITTKEIVARVPEGDARLTVAIIVVRFFVFEEKFSPLLISFFVAY